MTAYALTAETPETMLLGTTLRALHDSASGLAAGSRVHVATSVVQSIAAALGRLPQAKAARGADVAGHSRAQICAYIDVHLDDARLSATTIAAGLGFSRQHLYRLFPRTARSHSSATFGANVSNRFGPTSKIRRRLQRRSPNSPSAVASPHRNTSAVRSARCTVRPLPRCGGSRGDLVSRTARPTCPCVVLRRRATPRGRRTVVV